MTLLSAIPALPVRNVEKAVAFYRDRLGFALRHHDGGFAIVVRDAVEIHLWEANDPLTPGAEPYLAGSASCRIHVDEIHRLYAELSAQKVIHPNGQLATKPWGQEDFATLDADGNLIAFYAPITST